MLQRRLPILSLALLFTLLLVPAARAEQPLRWKFSPDKPLEYLIEQKATTTFNVEGVEFTARTRTAFDVTWTVTSVGEGGVATISQKVKRIRLEFHAPRVAGGALGDLDYDSQDGKPGEGRIWEAIKPVLLELPGSEFTLQVSPRGELVDMKLSEKLAEAVAKLPSSPMFAGGNLFSQEGLRGAMELAIQTLPEQPVAKEATWPRKIERKIPNAGAIVIDLTSTLGDNQTISGRESVRIGLKSNSSYQPPEAENAGLKLEIIDQSGSGDCYFDAAAGCTLGSRFRQELSLAGEFGANAFTQDIETLLSVTLSGCDLPAEEEADKP
ncbi:MAG: hypothetical protein AB7O62_20930 [Pirellulales bacterium]